MCNHLCLDRLNFEMQTNEREHEALEVLNKIIENPKAFGILATLHIDERSYFGSCKGNMLVSHNYFQLLTPNPIRLRPVVVVFLHYLAFSNDPSAFPENGLSKENLFADHGVILVVRIVCIAKLAVGTEFELEKLVAEFAFVTHVIPNVKFTHIICHCRNSIAGRDFERDWYRCSEGF